MDFNTQFQIPPVEQPKSKKGLVTILIIVGIILIAACGYILWAMMGSKDANIQAIASPTPTPRPTPSPTPSDEVSDLEMEANAYNASDLDAGLQSDIETELGS
ncbi:hypothetical protein KW782_02405 [Candidatus Parcubacteria bacterium]|nr:hypothetical protein [Candidatus Parcubacteria bacterium]